MLYAINEVGKRIHAEDSDKQCEYICPVCGGRVIPKQGEVNSWHYAHSRLSPCMDNWNYDMSEWHREWQEQFPEGNREVVIEFGGEKHRADVLAYGYVIEFQHSAITAEEFERRNDFYVHAGKKVIWVFDFRDEFYNNRVECYDEYSRQGMYGGQWKWKHPRRFLNHFVPHREKMVTVLFQFFEADYETEEEAYMERVVWAIEKNGESQYTRFRTTYFPGNKIELLQYMREKKL